MSTPVLLRNGQLARIVESSGTTAIGFALMGRTQDGQLELWDRDGRWREDRREHPLDIVRGIYVPLTAADLEKRSA